MNHPTRLLVLLALVSSRGFAADPASALPVTSQPTELRRDWIDPQTGHRIIRLSPDTGGSSLYFHQHSYTPEGDKLILRGTGGIATVDLTTLGVSPPKFELVLPNATPIATAWRTREAYFVDRERGVIMAVHLDSKATREVIKLPPQARSGAYAVNCDETLLVGIAPDPDGKVIPRTPPPNGGGGTLEANWAAGTPKMIYTVNIKTGEFKVIHRENDWTNHLQCSPTDPLQILFCHEGPWHFNDRTWTVRADGTPARLLHERTMNMEIEGHEFFSPDGKMVWYDLQTPRSAVFWLAGIDLATGHRTWYNLQRNEWSVHYNASPDGKLFAGDGGGPGSVGARGPDNEDLKGNGQWIYLFRPVMVKGSSFRDKKELIDIGYFKSERLVDMSNHNYSKTGGVEPNLTFTPDGKWIIFAGNFDTNPGNGARSITHTYAVEIAKPEKKS
jgi:oligogalacturonide lyase